MDYRNYGHQLRHIGTNWYHHCKRIAPRNQRQHWRHHHRNCLGDNVVCDLECNYHSAHQHVIRFIRATGLLHSLRNYFHPGFVNVRVVKQPMDFSLLAIHTRTWWRWFIVDRPNHYHWRLPARKNEHSQCHLWYGYDYGAHLRPYPRGVYHREHCLELDFLCKYSYWHFGYIFSVDLYYRPTGRR